MNKILKQVFSLLLQSIDDTSNFDDFPDVDLQIPSAAANPSLQNTGSQQPSKDWVFINYTFKRFEGLTQRGPTPFK